MESTNTEPILSILIAAYNMERYLAKPLASLEGIDGIEIIVINDGSKDGTSACAHEWAKDHANVVVIDKPNGHYGSAINVGLAVAKGTYVRLLDADDAFDPTGLRSFVQQLAEAAPVDAWVTDVAVIDEAEAVRETWSYDLPTDGPFGLDAVARAPKFLVMHALTYRTAFLRALAYCQTEGIPYTDNEWSTIPLLDVQALRYCPVVVYRYLLGRAGQSMAQTARRRNVGAFEQIFTRFAGLLATRAEGLSASARALSFRQLVALARLQVETLFFLVPYASMRPQLAAFCTRVAAVSFGAPGEVLSSLESQSVVFSSVPLVGGIPYLRIWRSLDVHFPLLARLWCGGVRVAFATAQRLRSLVHP